MTCIILESSRVFQRFAVIVRKKAAVFNRTGTQLTSANKFTHTTQELKSHNPIIPEFTAIM